MSAPRLPHLDEGRLVALGLGDGAPAAAEAEHLRGCAACAARLAEETALSGLLARAPRPEPPADLAAGARRRFRAARRTGLTELLLGGAIAAALLAATIAVALVTTTPRLLWLVVKAPRWTEHLPELAPAAAPLVRLAGPAIAASLLLLALVAIALRRLALPDSGGAPVESVK